MTAREQVFEGVVVSIEQTHGATQYPGSDAREEHFGEVKVQIGPENDPAYVSVPFPNRPIDGIALGQRVTLTFHAAGK